VVALLVEAVMTDQCEHLDKCGFFQNFKGNPLVVQQGWIRMYCSSKVKSDKCKRKEILKETSVSPPDNMTPTGVLIPTAVKCKPKEGE
jgi:hypothetical protein